MTHDEFIALLDPTNPRYNSLCKLAMAGGPEYWSYNFERKGPDLPEVVEQFRRERCEPIIDKQLQVVIGCSAHRDMRAELFRYHRKLTGMADWPFIVLETEESSKHADAYTEEGMGYHFSAVTSAMMAGHFITKVWPIVGEQYKPDQFDRILFRFYETYPD